VADWVKLAQKVLFWMSSQKGLPGRPAQNDDRTEMWLQEIPFKKNFKL
jgi:hypothetical protein